MNTYRSIYRSSAKSSVARRSSSWSLSVTCINTYRLTHDCTYRAVVLWSRSLLLVACCARQMRRPVLRRGQCVVSTYRHCALKNPIQCVIVCLRSERSARVHHCTPVAIGTSIQFAFRKIAHQSYRCTTYNIIYMGLHINILRITLSINAQRVSVGQPSFLFAKRSFI